MYLFSIFDAAVGAYSPPLSQPSRGAMLRLWTDWVNDPNRPFKAHAQDYGLYYIGAFNDLNGVVEGCTPERVCTAIDVLTP